MSITAKRVSAYLLDILFVYVLLTLITNIRVINPYYEKFEKYYEKYNEVLKQYNDKEITLKEMQELNRDNYYKVTKYSISSNIVIVVVILLYFGVFQKYNKGQTLGKKIMKLKCVPNDGKKVSIWQYLLRTLPMFYVFIGSICAIIGNSICVFLVGSNHYMEVSNSIVYLFLGISIIDMVMIIVREDKRGLHDIISNTKVELEELKK